MRNLLNLAAVLAVTAAIPCSPLTAQEGGAAGAFIVRLGNDTVAVERFTRTSSRMEGEVVTRVPSTSRMTYSGTLTSRGDFSSFEISRYASPESDSIAQRITMRFGADSVITELRVGDSVQRRAAAASPPSTLPFLNNSFAMHQLALHRLRGARQDSVAFPLLSPGSTGPFTLELRRHRSDSITARILFGGGGEIAHVGRTGPDGRLVELRGIGGSFGSAVERADAIDLTTLRRDFAARDRAGRGLGELSPRDTLRAQVAGATLEVDYGRPSARGRTILGGLIHEGVVWRLGANQATHLRTDRELRFGELRLPAGTYTLFAIPGRDRWTLIINRQTGQAGTAYDSAQDLGRVPMSVSRAQSPQEQLTIDLVQAAEGGVLRIRWGSIVAAAPFTVR